MAIKIVKLQPSLQSWSCSKLRWCPQPFSSPSPSPVWHFTAPRSLLSSPSSSISSTNVPCAFLLLYAPSLPLFSPFWSLCSAGLQCHILLIILSVAASGLQGGPGSANPVVELEQWWHDQSMLWEHVCTVCVCVCVNWVREKLAGCSHQTSTHPHNTYL